MKECFQQFLDILPRGYQKVTGKENGQYFYIVICVIKPFNTFQIQYTHSVWNTFSVKPSDNLKKPLLENCNISYA